MYGSTFAERRDARLGVEPEVENVEPEVKQVEAPQTENKAVTRKRVAKKG